MRNNLDLNTSTGSFDFDPADQDAFVRQLKRVTSSDKGGLAAYAYDEWLFFINGARNRCEFHMDPGGKGRLKSVFR